jgi:hypothetical protein
MEVDIIVSLATAAVLLTVIVQGARILRTAALHKTLRQAITSGQPVTSELIETLDKPAPAGEFDQRAGYVLIALGIATLVAALLNGTSGDSFREMATIAVFPLFVGGALLLRLRLNRRIDQA